MERITRLVNGFKQGALLVLYGELINDSFLPDHNDFINLDMAISMVSRKGGPCRFIVSKPDNMIEFMGSTSRELSNEYMWNQRNQVLQSGVIPELQTGPFGAKVVMAQQPQPRNEPKGLGDVHALNILDAMLRDTRVPTILFIRQAETWLNHFEDPRTLASIIGRWFEIPTQSLSRVYLEFSANSRSELSSVADRLPVPELRSLILTNIDNRTQDSPVKQIPSPGKDECARVLQMIQRRRNQPDLDSGTLAQLAGWMAGEELPLHGWMREINRLNPITIDSFLASGLIKSQQGDPRKIADKFSDLIGLESVIEKITKTVGWVATRKQTKSQMGIPSLNFLFSGNPGTGKTSLARLMGQLLHESGVLSRGHLVECIGADFIADHVGGTAVKVNQLIDQALNGVLFIDEAYGLVEQNRGGYGHEALEILMARMETEREHLVVIFAGYPGKMEQFLHANPGLSRRIPLENRIEFPDYSPEVLLSILEKILQQRDLYLAEETRKPVLTLLEKLAGSAVDNFGNAGEIRNLADGIEKEILTRRVQEPGSTYEVSIQDIPAGYQPYLPGQIPAPEEILRQLDHLVGLEPVKEFIRALVDRANLERRLSGGVSNNSSTTFIPPHLIFTGNPGTGKTTVAKIIARLMASLGYLPTEKTVEVTASDLIAGYLGQTGEKTLTRLKQATGGVLFLDEAYALSRNLGSGGNLYGQEAVDTIVKYMDTHRGKFVLIVAGYPEEMNAFIQSNPGLRSRFAPPILFPDIEAEDMAELLTRICDQDGFYLPKNMIEKCVQTVQSLKISFGRNFGNAREIISLYDSMKTRLSRRLSEKYGFSSDWPPGWNIFHEEDIPPEEHFPMGISLYRSIPAKSDARIRK